MRANNMIHLIGRLGNDPEIKDVGGGKVSTFSLAVTRSKTETDWFKCTAWNKLADLASAYLKKGSSVAVVGSVKITKKESNTYIDVIVDSIEFVGGGNKSEETESEPEQLTLETVGAGKNSGGGYKRKGSRDDEGTLPPF